MLRLLLCLCLPLSLFSWTISQSLAEAKKGDYTVYESARFDTFLLITETSAPLVTLEEITVPADYAAGFDFVAWRERGAPNHTGWMIYTIDTEKARVVHAKSRIKHAVVTPADCGLFNVLLSTCFAQEGELLVGRWPSDKSPLSGAVVLVRPSSGVFPQSIEIRPKEGRRWLYRTVCEQSRR